MTLESGLVEVNVERLEGHKVKLDITVDREEVDRAYHRAYRRLVGRVNIPGFRKGKVPRPVLERHLGPDALKDEALELILSPFYGKALDSKGLDPIDTPEVEVVKFAEGEPLVFRATVEVKPEVKLGEYKGQGVELEQKPVTDDDVQRQLDSIRERAAELEGTAPDTAIDDGHFAVVDLHGTIEDEDFPGGTSEGVLIQIGAGQVDQEVEKALKGAKAGETRKAAISFPEDHPNKDLAGKEAEFDITVKEVKVKKAPELDDETAKELTGMDLAALREQIRKNLEEQARRNALDERRQTVIEKVVEDAEVDLPETLVERRIESRKADMTQRLAQQGVTIDGYLEMVGLDKETWEKDLRSRAEYEVKRHLVLEAIGKKEGIEAADADVEFEISRMAMMSNEKPEKIREMVMSSPARLESVREGIILEKTVHYLVRENSAPEPSEEEEDGAGPGATAGEGDEPTTEGEDKSDNGRGEDK